MCTRFYVEPDTEEIREIIAEVQRSQLSGKFIKAGNAILTSGEIDKCCAGHCSQQSRKENCFPHEMGIPDTRQVASRQRKSRNGC